MAYHAKTTGVDQFKKRKTNTNKSCIVCEETINAGDMRYIESHGLSLCDLCYKEYASSHGNIPLFQLSRNKTTPPATNQQYTAQ